MTPDHIITTKLMIPANARQIVTRTRFMPPQQLPRMILVSAPAGYGKTTVLSTWARNSAVPVCWLSLDAADNDPVRFLIHFIASIQTRFPDFGKFITDMLVCTPPAPVAGLLPVMLGQICSLPNRLCVVLDDLHTVSDCAVHGALAFIVENQPPQLQLIIASRSDPLFSLARIRAQRDLLEYRASDLRFTLQETEIFCNEVMKFDLPQEQLQTLTARTEGWVVGLQLAAVSLENTSDKSTFIESFAGDNRHITDFLLDEVLRSRPDDIQKFLLQTSILDCFNASLCDAVTARTDSREMIDEMERTNMFIVGLDHQRNWYRYHHLFTSLLQSRLQATQSGLIRELYGRASKWCRENDLISEAVDYAIRATDYELAADLMEQNSRKLFAHGQINTVLFWSQQLPRPLLARRPMLSLMCAWGSFFMDDLIALDQHIRTISTCLAGFEKAPIGSKERAAHGQLALMRGWQNAYSGNLDNALTNLRDALASIPVERTLHRAAEVSMGIAYFVGGELDEARRLLEKNASIAVIRYNALVPINAVLGLARLHLLRGNLVAARQVYNKAMRESIAANWQDFPASAMLHIGMGELAYEMNELDEARHHLNRGIEMTGNGMQYLHAWGHVLLAQTQIAMNLSEEPLDPQTEALLLKYSGRFVVDVPPLSAAIGRLWLHQRRLGAARQWADTAQLPLQNLLLGREPEYLVLARYFIAGKKVQDAVSLLDKLWIAASNGNRVTVMIEILILKTLALHGDGRICDALAPLQQAAALAENTGLLRVFMNEAAVLNGLLRKLARAADYTSHVHYLIKQTAEQAGDGDSGAELHGPLFSKREREVVGHFVKGQSNQEIADALFISPNTLNTHMKKIYVKLGVNSRVHAVERLRKLGVIAA